MKFQKWFLFVGLVLAVLLVACVPLAETVETPNVETQTAQAGPVFAPVPEAPEGVAPMPAPSVLPAPEAGQEDEIVAPEGTKEQAGGGIRLVGTYDGDHLIESGQAKVFYTQLGTSPVAFVVMMEESDFGDRYVIPMMDQPGQPLEVVYRSSVAKTFVFTYEGIRQLDAFDALYRCAFISTADNLLDCIENLPRGQP